MLRDHLGLCSFLAAEAVVYIAFLYCDLAALPLMGSALKYGSILLCLLFSLANRTSSDGRIVATALAFTALADLFLLVLDAHYALGVACFCVVQLLYILRLRRAAGKTPLLWLRILLSAGTMALLGALHQLTPLTALVCLYFPQLICNALESLLLRHTGLPWRLFSAGLVLFLCCDICVGLHNLPLPSDALSAFAQFGMWLFYLPSQVLIVLSAWKGWSRHEP